MVVPDLGNPAPPDLPGDNAGMGTAMSASADRVEHLLAGLVRLAIGDAETALACGLTVRGVPNSRALVVASDDLALRMDEIQYALDDGPGLSCLRDNGLVEVADIAADERWPEFSRRGREAGAGASLSVPFSLGDRAVGALSLYARTPGRFTTQDRARMEDLAACAAGAVALAAQLVEYEERIRHLETAMSSRPTIDQAIGILIGRHGMTPSAAFEVLRQTSQDTNAKLRDIAAKLITDVVGDQS